MNICDVPQQKLRNMTIMAESVKQVLLLALQHVLKPLVRLSQKNGLTASELEKVVQAAYVDVAVGEIEKTGRVASDEIVASMTGLPVEIVSKIKSSESNWLPKSPEYLWTDLAAILNTWHVDRRFVGAYGLPLELDFECKTSAEPTSGKQSFTDLVKTVNPSLDASIVLLKFIEIGAVKQVGEEIYRPIKRSYVPAPMSAASLMMLAHVVHNHIETLVANQQAESAGGKGLMERIIFTLHGLNKDALKEFDQFIRVKGQEFANVIDDWLSKHDVEGQVGAVRTGIGFYHYVVNEDDEEKLRNKLKH